MTRYFGGTTGCAVFALVTLTLTLGIVLVLSNREPPRLRLPTAKQPLVNLDYESVLDNVVYGSLKENREGFGIPMENFHKKPIPFHVSRLSWQSLVQSRIVEAETENLEPPVRRDTGAIVALVMPSTTFSQPSASRTPLPQEFQNETVLVYRVHSQRRPTDLLRPNLRRHDGRHRQ